MANQTVTEKLITVHGRGSLRLPYKLQQKALDGSVVQIDLSDRVLYFEVDAVALREIMPADPADSLGKLIVLNNDKIVTLNQKPTRCSIRDETDIANGLPVVLWEGQIGRTGYVGAPDLVEDA